MKTSARVSFVLSLFPLAAAVAVLAAESPSCRPASCPSPEVETSGMATPTPGLGSPHLRTNETQILRRQYRAVLSSRRDWLRSPSKDTRDALRLQSEGYDADARDYGREALRASHLPPYVAP